MYKALVGLTVLDKDVVVRERGSCPQGLPPGSGKLCRRAWAVVSFQRGAWEMTVERRIA
jgi:hypothetical protein